jgi:hypothetical protein
MVRLYSVYTIGFFIASPPVNSNWLKTIKKIIRENRLLFKLEGGRLI